MFYQILLSPQVKQCASITYNHGTYELPHEMPNDYDLRKLTPISSEIVRKPFLMISGGREVN